MGQLGQEADGVHIQNGRVTRQLASMDGNVQCGKKLVSGLEAGVPRQSFDQSRFSWTDEIRRNVSLLWML